MTPSETAFSKEKDVFVYPAASLRSSGQTLGALLTAGAKTVLPVTANDSEIVVPSTGSSYKRTKILIDASMAIQVTNTAVSASPVTNVDAKEMAWGRISGPASGFVINGAILPWVFSSKSLWIETNKDINTIGIPQIDVDYSASFAWNGTFFIPAVGPVHYVFAYLRFILERYK